MNFSLFAPSNLFNKLLSINNTYYYYSSKEEYYKSLFREDNSKGLSNLIFDSEAVKQSCQTEIKFRDLEFNTPYAEVIEKLGKPRFTIDNSKRIQGHKVIFYKFYIGGHKVVSQIHFLNDLFFYGNYTFKDLNSVSLKRIEHILNVKYFSMANCSSSDTSVTDEQGNSLILKRGMYLTLKYISGKPEFAEIIKQQSQLRTEKRQAREEKRLKILQTQL